MTKTLTEQWRNGTLEQRYYYVKYFGNGQKPFVEIELKNFLLDLVKVKDRDKIEVLAAVPRYEQYIGLIDDSKELDKAYDKINLLEKKLDIATKALKEYANEENWRTATTIINTDYFEFEQSMYGLKHSGFEEAQQALKEIDLVGTSEKEKQ